MSFSEDKSTPFSDNEKLMKFGALILVHESEIINNNIYLKSNIQCT